MVLREVVHPLFEYTAKPADVVTVPLVDRVVDVVMAAIEISDKAIVAVMTNATEIATHKNLVFHLKSFFKKVFHLSLFFSYSFHNLLAH
jgi:hypothetical protein